MKSISRKMVEKVREIVKDGVPRTCPEIGSLCGQYRADVSRAMHELRTAGEAHVTDWRPYAFAGWMKVWNFGPGEDVPKPMALTKEQKNARYAERKRIGAIRREADAFVPFRHPHDVILFGPVQFSGEASAVPRRR